MRIASYIADGKTCFGVVSDSGVVTMNERLRCPYETLKQALEMNALADIRHRAQGIRPDHDLKNIEFLPLIPDPGKTLCVGINYRSHAAESGHAAAEKPNIFTKFDDTLLGHDGIMLRPKVSEQFDYEGELAVIIGKACPFIKESNALQ